MLHKLLFLYAFLLSTLAHTASEISKEAVVDKSAFKILDEIFTPNLVKQLILDYLSQYINTQAIKFSGTYDNVAASENGNYIATNPVYKYFPIIIWKFDNGKYIEHQSINPLSKTETKDSGRYSLFKTEFSADGSYLAISLRLHHCMQTVDEVQIWKLQNDKYQFIHKLELPKNFLISEMNFVEKNNTDLIVYGDQKIDARDQFVPTAIIFKLVDNKYQKSNIIYNILKFIDTENLLFYYHDQNMFEKIKFFKLIDNKNIQIYDINPDPHPVGIEERMRVITAHNNYILTMHETYPSDEKPYLLNSPVDSRLLKIWNLQDSKLKLIGTIILFEKTSHPFKDSISLGEFYKDFSSEPYLLKAEIYGNNQLALVFKNRIQFFKFDNNTSQVKLTSEMNTQIESLPALCKNGDRIIIILNNIENYNPISMLSIWENSINFIKNQQQETKKLAQAEKTLQNAQVKEFLDKAKRYYF